MPCTNIRETLIDFGWDATARQRVRAVLQHLDTCAECQAAMSDFDAITAALREVGQVSEIDAAEVIPPDGWEAFERRMQAAISGAPPREAGTEIENAYTPEAIQPAIQAATIQRAARGEQVLGGAARAARGSVFFRSRPLMAVAALLVFSTGGFLIGRSQGGAADQSGQGAWPRRLSHRLIRRRALRQRVHHGGVVHRSFPHLWPPRFPRPLRRRAGSKG